ncbi:glutathione S-transferase C-terminal domain-containing protein [Dankookia sp. GCM10030260]|uniref:glutathione S-transferase C-terminal domain-containing protein n=1 Tax=Dankookia sp. GCM10030260 TaxID=3273390 RepID=UPI003618E2DD
MDPMARTTAAPATLLTFPPMIDGELTRFVLDQHGVAYEERPHIAIVANLIALARARTIALPVLSGTVPAIAGARPVIDWAEAQRPPAQRLVPAGPAQAATVERLWHRANADLATATAAYAYFHLLPHREIMIAPLSRGAPGWEVFATRLAYPVFAGFIGKVLGLSADKAATSLTTIRAVFAECDALLADQRTFLTGDRLTLADIAMATAAAPLLLPEGYGAPIPPLEAMPPVLQDLVAELRRTRTAGFVRKVYRQRPAKA